MFQNCYSVEYLLTANLKWMKYCSNRFVSNVPSVWKTSWRGLSSRWQEPSIILVSTDPEKFPVFVVLLDLFISKIAGYNQECLLPTIYIKYWFQDWIPSRILKYRFKDGVDSFEQLFVFVCACLFICIFHFFCLGK